MANRTSYFVTKPEVDAQISWGAPITQGLSCVLLTNEKGGFPRDLVSNRVLDGTTSFLAAIKPVWSMSRGGTIALGAAGSYAAGAIPATERQRAATAVTVIIVVDDGINTGIGYNSQRPVIGVFDGAATNFSNWAIYQDDASNTFDGWVFDGAATNFSNWAIYQDDASNTFDGWVFKVGTASGNLGFTALTGGGLREVVGAGVHLYAFVGYNVGSDAKWDVWADGVFRETCTCTSSQLGAGSTNTNEKLQWISQPSLPILARAFWNRNLTTTELKALRSPLDLYNALLLPGGRHRMLPAAGGAVIEQFYYDPLIFGGAL